MNTAGDDPTIPPEWVYLSELSDWVDRIYGVSSNAIERELILTVRHKLQIPHRISCKPRDRTNSPSLPPGLVHDAWHGVRRVFVADWEVAEADWKAGTVGGWKQDDGTRERLAIEVPWEAVDHFVAVRLYGWRKLATADAPLNRTGAAGRPSSLKNLVAPELARPRGTPGTSGGEDATRNFLIAEMKANPDKPKSNADLLREVQEVRKFNVSERGFKRAKAAAIPETGAKRWGEAGSKSAH